MCTPPTRCCEVLHVVPQSYFGSLDGPKYSTVMQVVVVLHNSLWFPLKTNLGTACTGTKSYSPFAEIVLAHGHVASPQVLCPLSEFDLLKAI